MKVYSFTHEQLSAIWSILSLDILTGVDWVVFSPKQVLCINIEPAPFGFSCRIWDPKTAILGKKALFNQNTGSKIEFCQRN